MTEHLPVRPTWVCLRCDAPWPCAISRTELVDEYGAARTCLTLYLGSYMLSAAEDMSWVPTESLRRRFLGWLT
ncbi:hypothetical protein D0Q02_22085 [Micromonospora craniellae]|uniref:Flavin reductase n=1 Tax=Micromonospora craniellae TaxID=2294034 RepID=A0A372FV38_9ACTN|nr:hypothetical protein D0Q02_22085 [Micromonospora craniellae]